MPTDRKPSRPRTLADITRDIKQTRKDQKARRKPSPAPSKPKPSGPLPPPTHECEVEVAEGLEGLAWRELKTLFDERVETAAVEGRAGSLRFFYTGNPYQLLKLRTVQAVYFVKQYAVPRPKGLLGDQHFKGLLAQIADMQQLSTAGTYKTLHISAAGSDSSVMNRLKTELAAKLELDVDDKEGDLLIRVRRAAGDEDSGWETLVRLTPRPLATRSWRVCNREGALNAPVAYAMAMLSEPDANDVVVNLMCGSGTLLIERYLAGAAAQLTGYDTDAQALECVRRNIEAAGAGEAITVRAGDVRDLDVLPRSVDVVMADLPFGQLVGSHDDNVRLYPAVIKEAARITKKGGRALFITHEVRLMEAVLEESGGWETDQVLRVGVGGMHPRLFKLVRK
jgi:tRNA (guanine6-N2)-methyltransferase